MQLHKHHKTALYILSGIIAGAAVIYFSVWLGKSASQSAGYQPSGAPGAAGSPTPQPSASAGFPIQMGSSGSLVRQLQAALGNLTVDGIFGAKTQQALINKTGKATVDSRQEFNDITTV